MWQNSCFVIVFLLNIPVITMMTACTGSTPENCAEIKLASPSATTGIYIINLMQGSCKDIMGGNAARDGQCCVQVYCDMERFGGGWTVFQKRFNGSVDFYRNWTEYEVGFGSVSGEFYAGNTFLYYFTDRKTYELLVELYQSAENCSVYAHYSSFRIANSIYYNLSLGPYFGGNAGDSLSYHSGMGFSTFDVDNDISSKYFCARDHKGGWWYSHCHESNLNGEYHDGCTSVYAKYMVWYTSRGHYYSFKASGMKLRPVGYK